MDASNKLLELIRDVVKDNTNRLDKSVICMVEGVNEDGTVNIRLPSDIDNIINNIPNNSAYKFEYGDYAVLYKMENKLNNAFIIAKVTKDSPEFNIIQTYNFNGTSGGSFRGMTDMQVNGLSIVNNGVGNIITTTTYNESDNKITTEDFVNSSIATNTAYFRGTYNIVSDLGLTTSATEQQIANALATKMVSEGITPTNNDYCYVAYPDATDPTQFTKYDRYKYDGATSTWSYEYTLNNSSFTAAQWAAINSGISAGNYVTTVNGSSGAITVPVASLDTTSGSESVTVDSNTSKTLSVVTRNTPQTISGIKTFTNGIKLAPQSSIWNTSNIVTTNNDEVLGINTNGQVGFVSNVSDSTVSANAFTFRNVSTNNVSTNLFRIGTTNIRPESNNSYDCGTSSNRWRYVFAGTKMYTPAINAISCNICVDDTSTVKATMQYNSTTEAIEFVFN